MQHSLTNTDKHKILLWQFTEHEIDMQSFVTSLNFENSDLIFIVLIEGIMDTYKHTITGNIVNKSIHAWDSIVDLYRPNFHTYLFHWQETKLVYEQYNLKTKLVDPLSQTPSAIFDCFSASPRHHRDIFYDNLQSKKLAKHNIIRYSNWMPGSGELNEFTGGRMSGMEIPCTQERVSDISYFVPYKIYNQSWFSMVCETDCDRYFLTEKTAKPIIAKKAFYVLSAPGALSDLRALGFETFGDIFDESYDQIIDLKIRSDFIVEEIIRVNKEDPVLLYKKILPVLEHNYNHMFSLDWQKIMTQEMQDIINDK